MIVAATIAAPMGMATIRTVVERLVADHDVVRCAT